MFKKIDQELIKICSDIISEKKTQEEWSLIESDDYFKTDHYEGGFDSIEMAFCFSFYDDFQKEYFFQLNLDEVKKINEGILNSIHLREA